MRRFQALLITAGLAAVPHGAAAGPSPQDPWTHAQTYERFEWSTSKGRLGVMVMGLTPELRKHLGAGEDRGVLVARVEAGTPAAAAGIAVGDVIVAVRGHKVAGAADVLSATADATEGQQVTVDVIRDGKPIALGATLDGDAATLARPWGMFPWLRSFFAPLESRTLGRRT
jgi:membrane-associated protease RseP (regulator of RpoE activity)